MNNQQTEPPINPSFEYPIKNHDHITAMQPSPVSLIAQNLA